MQHALEAHRQAGWPLRIITTVYAGSTERRALDWLASIGAEVDARRIEVERASRAGVDTGLDREVQGSL
ncbi:MAG: hypothetical protein DMF95_25645 [Acidobacteria bacterium]|nr:MAG: hypothetical protein DMF94_12295 [Acidobacteriota bacterium]PYR43500.1 MAG: hypothetical protein DMF95_25645 [Acidobacteriota bacterium]